MRSPCPWFLLLRRVSQEQTRQGTPTHRCDAEDAEIVVPKVLAGATLGGRCGWLPLSAVAAESTCRKGHGRSVDPGIAVLLRAPASAALSPAWAGRRGLTTAVMAPPSIAC